MFNTHFANVIKVSNIVLAAEITAHFALFRRLDILVGSEVIHDHSYFVFVENFWFVELCKFLDSHRRGDIVAENEIEFSKDKLSRLNGVKSGMSRKNFLSHCHSHFKKPLFLGNRSYIGHGMSENVILSVIYPSFSRKFKNVSAASCGITE